MNVYRVEHKDWKLGPYSSYTDLDVGWYWGAKCPGPDEDGMDKTQLTYYHHFGFARMCQLLSWFRFRDIFKMRKKGFRVFKYKVNKDYVCFGASQCAFVRAKATVREEVPLARMARHLALRFGS